MQIGDDLNTARRFVKAAAAGLLRIDAGEDTNAALLDIQKGATELQARGIARSAECAMASISDGEGSERFRQHIYSLTQLLCQYTIGLDEIAPVNVQALTQTDSPAKANVIALDNVSKTHQASQTDQAKDTLAPLIRFAPAPEQRAALSFLAQFSSQMDADPQTVSGVYMETIMPAVTDHILSEARRHGKPVSVSYAVGEIRIPEDIAPDVQAFLAELGSSLAVENFATSLIHQSQELPACGTVNITASQEHGRLTLHVECSGQSPAETPLNLNTLSPLIARSGIFSVEQEGGHTLARLVNVDVSSDQLAPDTQAGVVMQEALA